MQDQSSIGSVRQSRGPRGGCSGCVGRQEAVSTGICFGADPAHSLGDFFSPYRFRSRSLERLYICLLCIHINPPPHPNISPVRLCFLYIIFLNFNFLIFFFLQLLKKLHGKNNSLYDTYTQSGVILYIIKDENSHFP